MSFSGKAKEELSQVVPRARHCLLAEMAGLYGAIGKMVDGKVHLPPDHEVGTRKFFTLLRKTFNIELVQCGEETAKAFLSPEITQRLCCRRAYLRGAFLAAGSMSDPEKSYHWEVVYPQEEGARTLASIMEECGFSPRVVARKKNFVVYVKDQDQISDLLAAMGAPVTVMELANVKILREMRGSVNRQVNCETANIGKTVSAAMRQLEDIDIIDRKAGLSSLPEALMQMAELRRRYPEATLQELGDLSEPRVGKSGVNHRLRRLGAIAESLRRNGEELI
ncbi:MAG: DNA-binding protein WhiA [Blautia sp.]|nr:DNA-binding protein WhiA [Blautia sp.]